MSKLIIIGNGYDLSLKLNITFSNFMETQKADKGSGNGGDDEMYVEYVEAFLTENSDYTVKKNIFKKGAAGYVSRDVDFRDVFSDINSWNELEVRLDNVYDDYDEKIFPINMEDFLEKFSEEFEKWLNLETEGKEFPETIKYVEYDENDIILNLNFTDTIPKGYKNEIKVHKLTGYDDFLYIGPYSIKNDSEVIQKNLSKVLKLLEESQEPIEKIVIYGANMHAKEVVDMHIVDFINDNIPDEISIDYINVGVKDLEQDYLQERFNGRKINYIDGNSEYNLEISEKKESGSSISKVNIPKIENPLDQATMNNLRNMGTIPGLVNLNNAINNINVNEVAKIASQSYLQNTFDIINKNKK